MKELLERKLSNSVQKSFNVFINNSKNLDSLLSDGWMSTFTSNSTTHLRREYARTPRKIIFFRQFSFNGSKGPSL